MSPHRPSLSMPADTDTQFGAIVNVLKECVHPVLFSIN